MAERVAQLSDRVGEVRRRIADAAQRAGRDPSAVTLVAITKTFPIEAVAAGYEVGLRHFGENRVEEAEGKIALAAQQLPGDVTWHMVGHIQSRKTHTVAELFPWVHSVDRVKIARRLAESAVSLGRALDILLEVNVSGEESKYGFELVGEPSGPAFEMFCGQVAQIAALNGVRLRGLMTMAPFTEDSQSIRPVFRWLRQLRDALQLRLPELELAHLSMGMSGDYEVAVEEGATLVRIGTAIFGPR